MLLTMKVAYYQYTDNNNKKQNIWWQKLAIRGKTWLSNYEA